MTDCLRSVFDKKCEVLHFPKQDNWEGIDLQAWNKQMPHGCSDFLLMANAFLRKNVQSPDLFWVVELLTDGLMSLTGLQLGEEILKVKVLRNYTSCTK